MTNPSRHDEARAVQEGLFDPYQLDQSHVLEPPTTFGEILRKTGPGIVLAASIVGSGELILTTTLGAKVGYMLMWLIILSCLIKAVVQSFLGRYTIAMAETGLDAVNRIPGPRFRVGWVVWAWAAMVFMTLFQITGMFIGVSQTMISTLTHIYTQTFGEWSKWLFYVGAIVILWGTIIAGTAGHSRMFADFMRLQGAFRKDDFKARSRYRDIFIVLLALIPIIFYFIFGQAPVEMVVWGAIAQAMMLPIISFGTVYLVQRHLPPELKAPAWLTGLLWLGAIMITGFVVPALLSELRKVF